MLCNVRIDKKDYEKAAGPRGIIDQKVEKAPELKKILPQLEAMYEVRVKGEEGEKRPKLCPEIKEILWEIRGNDLGKARWKIFKGEGGLRWQLQSRATGEKVIGGRAPVERVI